MKYEQTTRDLTTGQVLQSIYKQTITEAALELTPRGRDGWGDCGQGTWIMLDETKPGESLTEHRFFEEEVIHWLRHALPLKRQLLGTLPDQINLIRPEGLTQGRTQVTSHQLTAFALDKAGLLYHNKAGELEVDAATYAASCFTSGDIKNPEDRRAAALLDGIDVREEIKALRLLPLVQYRADDEYNSWWDLQAANIKKFDEEARQ